ncbi:uncharacterized protein LOC124921861 [Impatiens glandulifera]|uniref:uncharacterized protein LOC124921861 n=1 Tax=Impatiens glandulifera TaxID=253017 RepID=UPI001FB0D7A0|nr:uncharacterized protein LOC124921861 [Impatiens glandulifera]
MALNENFQVNDDGEKANSTSYRKLIGSLIYLNTRPDITYSPQKESLDIFKDQKLKTLNSKKKVNKYVALSSAKVEYIACTDAACKAIWLQRILKDMKFEQCEPTIIHCDNMSAIAMTKNLVFHVVQTY